MYMYIACTYMFMPVRNFVNMYIMIHVCTMYRDVCTDLPILVQVFRIPDALSQQASCTVKILRKFNYFSFDFIANLMTFNPEAP